MDKRIVVIADNGGNLILQIGNRRTGYQHTYQSDNAEQLAYDLCMAMAGDAIACWDGNEIDTGWVVPTDDEIRNGGYVVFTPLDLLLTCRGWGGADTALRLALPHGKGIASK